MPTGFSKKENENIKKELIKKGRKLFSVYGLKKTTISDLTEAVGIAQGTFYNFFDSKEELYFDILDIEGQQLRQDLTKYKKQIIKNPKKGIKALLLEAYTNLEENELFKDLFSGNTYQRLVRKLSDKKIEEHIQMDFSEIIPLIEKGQEKNIIKDEKIESITGILHFLFFISLHKDDIGNEVFNNSFELLVDLIVDGLIIKENNNGYNN